jgi:hypothetical protein
MPAKGAATMLALCTLLMFSTPSQADDLRNAQNAIGTLLQKGGGGLVAQQGTCPKRNDDPLGICRERSSGSNQRDRLRDLDL